jgi:beta-glucanase (GH16 family)
MKEAKCVSITLLSIILLLLSCASCSTLSVKNNADQIFVKEDLQPFYYEFKGNVDWNLWEYNKWWMYPTLFQYSEIITNSNCLSLRTSRLASSTNIIGTVFNYCGMDISTPRFFGYGKYTARMRPRIVSGTVGAFYLMNQYESGHWLHKEIDIEFLGKDRHLVQFNVHRFYQDTESAYGSPSIYTNDFDTGADFHNYSIIWASNKIEWQIDGTNVYEFTDKIPDVHLNIRMANWVCGTTDQPWGVDWVGPINDADLPGFVDYAWVKYEPW